jgi:hypothetical protein
VTEAHLYWLHGERENGAHAWLPFLTLDQLAVHVAAFVPCAPPDTIWSITDHTRGG